MALAVRRHGNIAIYLQLGTDLTGHVAVWRSNTCPRSVIQYQTNVGLPRCSCVRHSVRTQAYIVFYSPCVVNYRFIASLHIHLRSLLQCSHICGPTSQDLHLKHKKSLISLYLTQGPVYTWTSSPAVQVLYIE